jgi:general secretion pathway protein J
MTARRNGEAGFTLVEVLVALAVTSLLAGLLYQGLRLGNRAWLALSARAAAADEVMVAHGLLRQVLDQAYPLPAPTAQGYQVDFQGQVKEIVFWTPPPDIWAYPGGIIQARLQLRNADGRRDLVLALSEDLADPRRTEQVILLRGIADIAMEYFGAVGTAVPAWRGNWQGQPALPQLVRLRVAFADKDRRIWPDFVVAPKVDLDTECVMDPLTQRCRGR